MLNKSILLLLCCLVSACSTSPTGRSQFLYMSDTEINKMGVQAFDDLKTKNAKSTDSKSINFVTCISNAITRETGGKWEVVVFKDKSLNAFALPGNKIGVHTGLVDLVDNQHQLAAVIGHEVGHVLAQHSNERVSQKMAVSGGVALISAVSSPTSAAGKLAVSALGIGAEYGIILPFSRTHESEADIMGLEFMAKAGFDPRESINLWKKMAAASKGDRPTEFLSTHPSNDTRISDLSAHMPNAMALYQQAQSAGKRPSCRK